MSDKDDIVVAYNKGYLRALSDYIDNGMFDDCMESNWDGYDADPLTHKILERTKELLKNLYEYCPPDLFPDPQGNMVLEWYHDKDNIITVSVAEDQITFLWLTGGMIGYSGGSSGDLKLSEHIVDVLDENFRIIPKSTDVDLPVLDNDTKIWSDDGQLEFGMSLAKASSETKDVNRALSPSKFISFLSRSVYSMAELASKSCAEEKSMRDLGYKREIVNGTVVYTGQPVYIDTKAGDIDKEAKGKSGAGYNKSGKPSHVDIEAKDGSLIRVLLTPRPDEE